MFLNHTSSEKYLQDVGYYTDTPEGDTDMKNRVLISINLVRGGRS